MRAGPKDERVDETGFLGGRVLLRQPRRGHRAGTDAALVIAAARPYAQGRILDLGAGTGAIGISLAVLDPAVEVALVEIDAELAALAALAAEASGCAERVRSFAADVERLARSPPSRRVLGEPYDLVVMKSTLHECASFPALTRSATRTCPPRAGGRACPLDRCRRCPIEPEGNAGVDRSAGEPSHLLASLRPSFGSIAIRPVQPRAAEAATRILMLARKGGRAPLSLLPPLVLHERDGSFTPLAAAIHQGDAELGFLSG